MVQCHLRPVRGGRSELRDWLVGGNRGCGSGVVLQVLGVLHRLWCGRSWLLKGGGDSQAGGGLEGRVGEGRWREGRRQGWSWRLGLVAQVRQVQGGASGHVREGEALRVCRDRREGKWCRTTNQGGSGAVKPNARLAVAAWSWRHAGVAERNGVGIGGFIVTCSDWGHLQGLSHVVQQGRRRHLVREVWITRSYNVRESLVQRRVWGDCLRQGVIGVG